MSEREKTVLEVIGLLLIVVGIGWLWSIPVALIAAGVGCIGVSYLNRGGGRR